MQFLPPTPKIKRSQDREALGYPFSTSSGCCFLLPPASRWGLQKIPGNSEPGCCLFCLCTVALARCFLSQFARSGALQGTRGLRREPGWRRRRRCRRLWYVRGRDCISKDPPFSPRHHHHSSAASPTAQAPAAAAAASNLPLPPPPLLDPPLQRGAHPHIPGSLPPAPPTFKCTGGYKCTHSPSRDLPPHNEKWCSCGPAATPKEVATPAGSPVRPIFV